MSDDLIAVDPLDIAEIPPAPQSPPKLAWVPVSALRINREYQREVESKRSMAMMHRIVGNFCWSRFKALSVQQIDSGLYEITDGQHSAIVAATLGIEEVPCLISPSESVADRAAAFVGINRERMSVDALPLFWARVAADDENAGDVAEVAADMGVAIPRTNKSQSQYKPNDCVAVKSLMVLNKRGGRAYVRAVLEYGVACELIPIGKVWIDAFALLCWADEFQPRVPVEMIGDIVDARTPSFLLDDTKARAAASGQPVYRCLAAVLNGLARRRLAA